MLRKFYLINLQLFADGQGEEEIPSQEEILEDETVEETKTEEGTSEEKEEQEEGTSTDVAEATEGGEDNPQEPTAFAKRLAKEKEKIEAQYARQTALLEHEAEKNGMSVEEYLQAVEETNKEEAKRAEEEERQKYAEVGLSEEDIEALKWAKENKPKIEKQNAYVKECQDLVQAYPNIKSMEDIPQEVIDMRLNDNVPLKYAMGYYMSTKGQSNTALEQKAMQDAIDKQNRNPGDVGGGADHSKVSVNDMSKEDFETLLTKIKRGEVKSI